MKDLQLHRLNSAGNSRKLIENCFFGSKKTKNETSGTFFILGVIYCVICNILSFDQYLLCPRKEFLEGFLVNFAMTLALLLFFLRVD